MAASTLKFFNKAESLNSGHLWTTSELQALMSRKAHSQKAKA